MLKMMPHPEGGHYAETWRADAPPGDRSPGTAIYYLLQSGEVSHWHRVDAGEIWHFYDGAPLELSLSSDGLTSSAHILGRHLDAGERPQVLVCPRVWQSARSLGAWTLAGCTVSPGFTFDGFDMAPPGWRPGDME
ncbi:cupin domain-containing protein [Aestuariivirga sp.]|uniref:cupin domain-containing protein n=1 Tax=Aestuariivirga sp. TaxID=2650926 RepID=UPI0039E30A0E